MFGYYPILSRFFVFLFLPFALLLGLAYKGFISQPLPVLDGTVTVSGIVNSVEVTRNKSGVPTIIGRDSNDIYFAMGYLHAQDRLWQLEVQRRFAQGRLSEVFGRQAIAQDIWIRSLGLVDAAKQAKQHLSPAALDSLQAYSRGINQFIQGTSDLPIEFNLLSIEPEPWTIIDSLTWIKVFALNLSGNYRTEIQRFVSATRFTPQELQQLFPQIYQTEISNALSQQDLISEKLAGVFQLAEVFERDLQIGGKYVGSNAWVVSGKLTESGKPILANDPHLGLQIPSLWYAVVQKGDDLDVSGMSLVGLPLVIFGANRDISWGGTNMMADVQDLYVERVNPDNPNQYWADGRWMEFVKSEQRLQVKAAFPAQIRAPLMPIEITTRKTIHGPVISDTLTSLDGPVSMRWTALDNDDTSYDAFLQLNKAHDWHSFNQALSLLVAPALNVLYMDKQDNIGLVGAGRIPRRKKHSGEFVIAGSDPDSQWQGYLSAQEMPRYLNPPAGYIINANNDNTPAGYPHFISSQFAPGYRAQRIEQLLQQQLGSGQKITSDYTQQMQLDVQDLSVQPLLQQLLKMYREVSKTDAQSNKSQALKRLADWQGDASVESVGATLFYGWQRHIRHRLFSDELSANWNRQSFDSYLEGVKSAVESEQIAKLLAQQSEWCDVVGSLVVEDCFYVVDVALDDSLRELEKLRGSNIDNWRWGKVQQTLYKHTPFSQTKVLRDWFEQRIDNGGSPHTVNVAASSYQQDHGYVQVFGAGFRQIIQIGADERQHWINLSTGQSGQVGSQHYQDKIGSFQQGLFEPIDLPVKHRLILQAVDAKGDNR